MCKYCFETEYYEFKTELDFEKFSKLVEFINKDKAAHELIAEEDIFEELMKATGQVEGFDDYLASGKGARRGRKRNSTEQ